MTDKKIENMSIVEALKICKELAKHIHSQCTAKCMELLNSNCEYCGINICNNVCNILDLFIARCHDKTMLLIAFLNLMGCLEKERDCNTLGGDEQVG